MDTGPKKLSDLVLQCCDYDGTKRPSFDQILSTLTKLLDKELKHEPAAPGGDPETKADASTTNGAHFLRHTFAARIVRYRPRELTHSFMDMSAQSCDRR